LPVKDHAAATKMAKKDESKPGPERNDKRVHVALPIRITYWDKDKKPGLEMACTYDISSRGARITSLRCIKDTGEIVAIERGRNKSFCRVVWIGDANTELKGQIGLQSVESERAMFEGELKELGEVFEPVSREPSQRRANTDKGNRRQQERLPVSGMAEIMKPDKKGSQKVVLKDLSEMGCLVTTKEVLLPGTDLKLVINVANYSMTVKGQVKHSALDLGVGIEFSEIRKGDRDMLKHLLKKLEEKNLEEVFQLETEKP
jgi:hypothetical protein